MSKLKEDEMELTDWTPQPLDDNTRWEAILMLSRIRRSLEARLEGRNEGGDTEVMRLVDEIVKRSTKDLRKVINLHETGLGMVEAMQQQCSRAHLHHPYVACSECGRK